METTEAMSVSPDVLLRTLERERGSRKQAERLLEDKSRELYLAQEELRSNFEAMQKTQSQLVHSEKMASVGQLAAGVAHEINNPIGFVTSNVQTLGDYVGVYQTLLELQSDLLEALHSGQEERLAAITAEIARVRDEEDLPYLLEDTRDLLKESGEGLQRVRDIVQNLKSFVHLDKAEEQLADINEGLDATLRVVWNELKYKCTIQKNYGTLPRVRCFAGELNQVFLNLLVNAAQAIEGNGVISITTETEAEHVVVKISDTGCGIPAEHMQKLFTPFFTTKPVGSGTGLGLSVSFGIIRKHKGTISAHSELNRGTTFTIRIPTGQ